MYLLSRTLADDYPLLQSVSVARYGEFICGFTDAFQTALPRLTRQQLAWRLSFGLLLLLGAFSNYNNMLRVFLYSDIAPALDADATPASYDRPDQGGGGGFHPQTTKVKRGETC